MPSMLLYHEYRLIERDDVNINRAWKSAHLLLFFLAFVFGSFCTFCFHMLMYLFDEKCVLFPKLLSLTSMRHNVIYEFIPSNKDLSDLPVDFLSTQWVDKSTCALPTYVPLISGIFGLVWTTMYLMCSSGSRTLTGLQRPWRVQPPVFVFSVLMGGLCTYSSVITHYGLQELCIKLGEITGSSTCTYTVNVATLTYERRIRGVYQATQLTIITAWLHTACWVCSALLSVARVLLAVDFQLVRVRANLHGDVDRMMERQETHIQSISPDYGWINDNGAENLSDQIDEIDYGTLIFKMPSETFLRQQPQNSEISLVPEERIKLARIEAYKSVSRDKQFIVKMVFDLIEVLPIPNVTVAESEATMDSRIDNSVLKNREHKTLENTLDEMDNVEYEIRRILQENMDKQLRIISEELKGTTSEIKELANEVLLNLKRKLEEWVDGSKPSPPSRAISTTDLIEGSIMVDDSKHEIRGKDELLLSGKKSPENKLVKHVMISEDADKGDDDEQVKQVIISEEIDKQDIDVMLSEEAHNDDIDKQVLDEMISEEAYSSDDDDEKQVIDIIISEEVNESDEANDEVNKKPDPLKRKKEKED